VKRFEELGHFLDPDEQMRNLRIAAGLGIDHAAVDVPL
jgi:hypothetical protein